jgi:hypothetical protein
MKKFIVMIIGVVVMAAMLSGCNKAIGPGNYSFKKVHIDTPHYSGCLTIEKWHDDERGIEVKTKEAGAIFLSEGTYILLDGDKGCPLCDGGKG